MSAPAKGKRRKAKFHAGQIVRVLDGSYGKLVYPHEAHPLQCAEGQPLFSDEGYVYVEGAKDKWYHYNELHCLTRKERGQ